MARLHGKDGRVLLNEFSVSAQINGWTYTHSRAYAQVAVLGDDGDRWLPGQLAGSVSLKGLTDSDDGLRSEAITAAGVDDSLLVAIYPAAFTVGSPALLARCVLASFTTDSTIRDASPAVIEGQADDGVDAGFTLHGLTAETADGSAASVDNAVLTSSGLVAMLNVTAYSGLTSAVVTVEHSTNNSTWATLVTFATVTGLTSERKAVTGTVNRYLRATVDVTGTGTVTYAVAAARR